MKFNTVFLIVLFFIPTLSFSVGPFDKPDEIVDDKILISNISRVELIIGSDTVLSLADYGRVDVPPRKVEFETSTGIYLFLSDIGIADSEGVIRIVQPPAELSHEKPYRIVELYNDLDEFLCLFIYNYKEWNALLSNRERLRRFEEAVSLTISSRP